MIETAVLYIYGFLIFKQNLIKQFLCNKMVLPIIPNTKITILKCLYFEGEN